MLGACRLATYCCLASLVCQRWLRPQFHLCFGLVEALSALPPVPCQHRVVIQKQDLAESRARSTQLWVSRVLSLVRFAAASILVLAQRRGVMGISDREHEPALLLPPLHCAAERAPTPLHCWGLSGGRRTRNPSLASVYSVIMTFDFFFSRTRSLRSLGQLAAKEVPGSDPQPSLSCLFACLESGENACQ